VHSGLHAVADLRGVDAESLCAGAAERELELMPLSAYFQGDGPRPNALLLGFGAVRPAALRSGMAQLAAAIEETRRARYSS
jgi:DNA-binding transcriptional MocR family regulator